jgi:hypothetical protein
MHVATAQNVAARVSVSFCRACPGSSMRPSASYLGRRRPQTIVLFRIGQSPSLSAYRTVSFVTGIPQRASTAQMCRYGHDTGRLGQGLLVALVDHGRLPRAWHGYARYSRVR